MLLGTLTFSSVNQLGYDTYTVPALSGSVETALVNALNSGANIRFAVTPTATGVGATDVDWRGIFSGQSPTLTFNVGQSVNQTQEAIQFSSATYSVSETGGFYTVNLTRSGVNTADSATVQYATSDLTAMAGTNYTATSGTANFSAGATTTSFNVYVNDVVPQGGDKTLQLTLSNPVVSNNSGGSLGTVGVLGTNSTATLTIDDTTAASETLVGGVAGAANYEHTGDYDDTEFKAGGTAASYESYGVEDFALNSAPMNTVTAIDSISLSIANVNAANQYVAPGPVDFYLATSSHPLIIGAGPAYQTSNGIEGVGNQEGTLYRLGTFNITDTTAGDMVTIPLAGFNQAAENALISYLNGGSTFRLVMTPESATVNADFLPGSAQLSISVQETSTSGGLPAWLSPDSQATFSKGSETLTVTGPTTFIGDPSISGDQTVAVTDSTGSNINFNVASGTAIHIGSLTLSGSSTASLANSSKALLILGTNTLSIDSSSTLDLGGSYLDVATGSLSTIDGYIKNKQLTSSLLASNTLTSLGAVLDNTGSSTTLISTIDGTSLASTDVVVKLTYLGDATLDGKVDASDYSRIDNGFLHGLTGWYNGDFNYDGVVNGSDYTLMDNAFNRQGPVIATPAAIIAPAVATAIPTPTASTATDSFFSDKKVSESLISEVEDVVTAVN